MSEQWKWPETGKLPTDADLARVLPTLPLEQRIETVIRKYVGGAISRAYDGETPAPKADAEIAKAIMRKLRPWLVGPAQDVNSDPGIVQCRSCGGYHPCLRAIEAPSSKE